MNTNPAIQIQKRAWFWTRMCALTAIAAVVCVICCFHDRGFIAVLMFLTFACHVFNFGMAITSAMELWKLVKMVKWQVKVIRKQRMRWARHYRLGWISEPPPPYKLDYLKWNKEKK